MATLTAADKALTEEVLSTNLARAKQVLPGADYVTLKWQQVEQDLALLTLEVAYGNRKRVINGEVSLGRCTTLDEAKAALAYHFGAMTCRILKAIGDDDERGAWELTRAKPVLSKELGEALDALDQVLEQQGG